ncbi:hypothetical protein ACFTUC_35800 [Streptomyces sp. NPDC056944]|uniref:hypothetical protein n=1 Tax=Streptomyces sp. NPDC056944 TaxID=3345972 RepID=UPI0036352195
MGNTRKYDEDAVLRARVLLLGSGRLDLREELGAYRVLAEVSPRAYLPKLVGALLLTGYRTTAPGAELPLYAEAVDAARRIEAGAPNRLELLRRALGAYERKLFALGRRAEGRAACEEMHALDGTGRLAYVLAEEGRHREAAEIHRRERTAGTGSPARGVYELTAELSAAGLHEEAAEAFARTVDAGRRRAAEKGTPPPDLAWELVHHARLLEDAGRPAEGAATRREALDVVARLAERGEPGDPMDALWATLFVLSGRSGEPAASPEAPMPPFGVHGVQWSPDVREAYREDIPTLEAEAARHAAAGALSQLYAVHRRLTLRAAHFGHPHGTAGLLRPRFDEGVALARRLEDTATALPQALTDRAMFLVATGHHAQAHADLAEATALLGDPPIVTRT